MVTLRFWAVVMLLDAGVTATVGEVGFWLVPPPPWFPPLHAPIERRGAKRRDMMDNCENRFMQKFL
jgi:hypothetical protein